MQLRMVQPQIWTEPWLFSCQAASDSLISWTVVHQAPLSFTISQNFLKFISMESVMLSKHLILYQPLLLLFSIFRSIRVVSNESALCIRWGKDWSFSFSSSLSSECSELISFRIDQFDLLAVQGSFKSFLQHHSLKASVLWWSFIGASLVAQQ